MCHAIYTFFSMFVIMIRRFGLKLLYKVCTMYCVHLRSFRKQTNMHDSIYFKCTNFNPKRLYGLVKFVYLFSHLEAEMLPRIESVRPGMRWAAQYEMRVCELSPASCVS